MLMAAVHRQTFPSLVWEEFVIMVRRGWYDLKKRRFRNLRWMLIVSLSFAVGSSGFVESLKSGQLSDLATFLVTVVVSLELWSLTGPFVLILAIGGSAERYIKENKGVGRLAERRAIVAAHTAFVSIGALAVVVPSALLVLAHVLVRQLLMLAVALGLS